MRIRSLASIVLVSTGFAAPSAEATHKLPRYGCRLVLTSEEDLRPSRVTWTNRVQDACPIKDQGMTNSCWIHAGADFYAVLLRKHGFLSSEDELSVPYYFAVSVLENLQALAGIPRRFKNLENREKAWNAFQLDGGGSLDFFRDLVLKYGLVTRKEFRETLEHSDSIVAQWPTLKFNERLKAFQERIKGSSPETFPDLFREEFGDLESIAAGFRKDISRRTLAPLLEVKVRLHSLGSSLSSLDRVVRKLVDRGVATHVDLAGNSSLDVLNSKAGYTFIHSDAFQRMPEEEHALLIVGYREENGVITHYLLKNSAGETYGENGYFTADRTFMTHWLTAVYDVRGDALPPAQR